MKLNLFGYVIEVRRFGVADCSCTRRGCGMCTDNPKSPYRDDAPTNTVHFKGVEWGDTIVIRTAPSNERNPERITITPGPPSGMVSLECPLPEEDVDGIVAKLSDELQEALMSEDGRKLMLFPGTGDYSHE